MSAHFFLKALVLEISCKVTIKGFYLDFVFFLIKGSGGKGYKTVHMITTQPKTHTH